MEVIHPSTPSNISGCFSQDLTNRPLQICVHTHVPVLSPLHTVAQTSSPSSEDIGPSVLSTLLFEMCPSPSLLAYPVPEIYTSVDIHSHSEAFSPFAHGILYILSLLPPA